MIYNINKCICVDILTFVTCRKYFTNINKVVITLKCIYFTFVIYIFRCRICTLSVILKIVKVVLAGSYLLRYSVAWSIVVKR